MYLRSEIEKAALCNRYTKRLKIQLHQRKDRFRIGISVQFVRIRFYLYLQILEMSSLFSLYSFTFYTISILRKCCFIRRAPKWQTAKFRFSFHFSDAPGSPPHWCLVSALAHFFDHAVLICEEYRAHQAHTNLAMLTLPCSPCCHRASFPAIPS